MTFRQYLDASMIRRSFMILSRNDRRKVLTVTLVQISMSLLDLLGVLAIGLLGVLSVNKLQQDQQNKYLKTALDVLGLSKSTFESQIIVLALIAIALLIGRTILSIFFTRRIMFFLSRRGAHISSNLISRLLSHPYLIVQSRTTQETLYAVTRGVELIVIYVIATLVVLIADFSLLIIMTVGLFIIDPTTAFGTTLIFVVIGFFLYRFMNVRAGALGIKSSELNIMSNEKIVEVFSSYRESVVRNRRDYYAREIGKMRFFLADVSAEISFMPYVGKYVIETSVILGALLIAAMQFLLQDATHAVGTLAVFLTAGSRIAPAVLRIQQSLIMIRSALGQAKPTLDLIDELGNAPVIENLVDIVDTTHAGFDPVIIMENISFRYPNKPQLAISDISLFVPAGQSVAIVGTSGSGKTTIIDVLLGVLPPEMGKALISGVPPLAAIAKWPGAISYVPQDVVISSGSIRENVALGYPPEAATDELVMHALKIAHLDKFALGLPNGIDSQVGERGAKISGGQRQRLGIARAMFTMPHLLVLDEATSSLDAETEAGISEAIYGLRGSTTVIMIAHRLSTVRNADIVIYLHEGKVLATGSFEDVRDSIPDFDRQAKLMGL
jgi:ABC-type multidrug transport system fused ATPase/permease subunit